MCKIVGADFNKIDFCSSMWFHEYEWTYEEEEKFKKWFLRKAKWHKKIRNELFSPMVKTEASIKKAIDLFVFNYGWKIKDENKEM